MNADPITSRDLYPDAFGPYRKYSASVRRLRRAAREHEAAGRTACAAILRLTVADMREARGMKGRRLKR